MIKSLIASVVMAVCCFGAEVVWDTNQPPRMSPEPALWRFDTTNVLQLTVATNAATNWVALEMADARAPKKYIGVLQTNRVLLIIYRGRTNEMVLDNLWTEGMRVREVRPAPEVKK